MFNTLRARLIGVSVSIAVLTPIVLSSVTFGIVRGNTLSALDDRISSTTRGSARELSDWVANKQRTAHAVTRAIALVDADPMPALDVARLAGDMDSVGVGMSDKRAFFSGWTAPAGYDATTRPWYQLAVKTGTPTFTAPYVDAASKTLYISFVEPVLAAGGGAAIGVATADSKMTSIVKKVSGIRPLDKSFALLVDGSNHTILAHERQELTLKPVTDLAKGLDAALLQKLVAEGGRADVEIDGAAQMVYAAKVDGTPWVLLTAVDRAEATAGLNALMRTTLIIAVLCVLVAGALVSAFVHRQLRRLDLVRDALEDIASGDGDLTRRMDSTGGDELSQIAAAFNRFADKISSVLLRIRESSESVRVAASEIATGNNDLSVRTESQASALQQTAAAMDQLTGSVRQNAESAAQADQLVAKTAQVASRGGDVMQQVVRTMGGIDAASRKIVDIIGTIDGIAFQTNILALNASVEAARAGEQGRGFAVVAAEVRTLASRSADAAKQIKTLINDSVEQVGAGSSLVQDAGATMQEVVDSIRGLTTIVAEISSASREQSGGITEVGSSVSQMDQGTQQNAALVEEAAAAAQSLQQQATALADAVAGFKLPQGQRSMA
ncbi:methyl-accepting chemotaxis protein [Pseudaquabacterium rugosum]|uniref:Methyl-accepting chemotaxis protein n=1 Tax=Pseudaquabacterium rugosum TaxID=2984194 RepID=A0ABU9BGE4_9BURK